jgi:SAM-dependent methyltransferase
MVKKRRTSVAKSKPSRRGAHASVSDPAQRLRGMIFGAIQAQAMCVAAELSIPDLLRDGAMGLHELAAATKADVTALERLMRLLVQMGVVTESRPAQFTCTGLGKYLQADVPSSLRNYTRLTNLETVLHVVARLQHSIRTAESQYMALHGEAFYPALQHLPAEAAIFNGAMQEISEQDIVAIRESHDFSRCRSVVDVGGGQGHLLAALLDDYPDLHGVLLDVPGVIAGAGEILQCHVAGGRCRVVGGDFLQAVPAGGDLYLLKRVLSHCSGEHARKLLSNIRTVIAPQGRLLVADPDPASLYGASFDVLMLVLLGGGLRTGEQLRELFAATGFAWTRTLETSAELHLIEATPA